MNGSVCGSPYEWLAIAALPLAALSGTLKTVLTRQFGARSVEGRNQSD